MKLRVTGININTVNQERIEQQCRKFEVFFIELVKLINKLRAKKEIEAVLVSTCNRFEIVLYSDESVYKKILSLLKKEKIKKKEIFTLDGMDVVEHIFRVVSGMESEIPGETMVSSQIKGAYARSFKAGITGKVLNKLFQKSINTNRRIREENDLDSGYRELVNYGIRSINRITEFQNENFVFIGNGSLLNKFNKSLEKLGCRNNLRIIRDYRGDEKNILNLTEGRKLLKNYSFFIVESNSIRFDLRLEDVREILNNKSEEIIILDYSLNRAVDPEVRNLTGVNHFSRDELEPSIEKKYSVAEIYANAEKIILSSIEEFESWFSHIHSDRVLKFFIDDLNELFSNVLKKSENHEIARKKFREKSSRLIRSKLKHIFSSREEILNEVSKAIELDPNTNYEDFFQQ